MRNPQGTPAKSSTRVRQWRKLLRDGAQWRLRKVSPNGRIRRADAFVLESSLLMSMSNWYNDCMSCSSIGRTLKSLEFASALEDAALTKEVVSFVSISAEPGNEKIGLHADISNIFFWRSYRLYYQTRRATIAVWG